MAKLGDIATYINGYAFKPEDWSDTGLPIIRIQDLTGNGYQANRYNGKYDARYLVNPGDVLISWSASLGVYVWENEPALLNQHIFKVVFDKAKVDKSFFVHQVRMILEKAASAAHGATMKHLTKPVFDALPFYLPSIDEQRKIASELDKVDNLIFLRKKQLQKLDDLIKSRFVEMFGDENNLMTMSKICLIITDGTHQPPKFRDTGIPFILVSNIASDKVTYGTDKFIDQDTYDELIRRTPIEIGDILLSTVGSYGHPAVVKTEKKFLFQRHIAYLKPRMELVDSDYLHSALLSPDAQRQIEEGVKGIAQKTLNLSEIKKIRIPIPALERQKEFAVFIVQVEKTKSVVKKALDEAQLLFDSLLQQYFVFCDSRGK